MKASRRKTGLVTKILAGIACGVLLGLFLPDCGIRVLNTFRGIFLDFVKFLVPLIILTFLIPAVADSGKGAGRMLLCTLGIAYAFTLASGGLSFAASRMTLPRIMSSAPAGVALKASLRPYFSKSLQPLMGIEASLVLSVLVGLGITIRGGETVLSVVKQLQGIVSWILSGVVMRMLPVYIATVVADVTATGSLVVLARTLASLMLFCVGMTLALVILQYLVAGLITHHNPFRALCNMFPAYLTGLGCCSSAASMPVTLRQTLKNGVAPSTANLVVPICANIHLSGSICNMVAYAVGILVISGQPIRFAAFALFIVNASLIAVAGIPGGMALASAGIAESLLGISPEWYAVVITIYMVLDGVGTACNVAGGGAVALIVERLIGRSPPKAFMPTAPVKPVVAQGAYTQAA